MRRLFVLLLLAAAGCNQPDAVPTVAEIVADPARFHEQLLEIEGTASGGSGLFSLGVYDFADETGTITVITNDGLPADGATFRIRGSVSTGVTIAGRRFGTAFYEEERLYPDGP